MRATEQVPVVTRRRWEAIGYERVIHVRYEPRELVVRFGDGSEARVKVDQLDSYGVREDEWPLARADDYHVSVPTTSDDIEIPWDVLRYLTDSAFREYWDEVMFEAGRQAGTRFRELREARNLSLADLAKRAGIAVADLGQIESGNAAANLDLEERVLAAMGCSFADLSQLEHPDKRYANT
jgi:DNA-binding XRE family transcriptional regulator